MQSFHRYTTNLFTNQPFEKNIYATFWTLCGRWQVLSNSKESLNRNPLKYLRWLQHRNVDMNKLFKPGI